KTWSYSPGVSDPAIKYWVKKQGNDFTLYWEVAVACGSVNLACLQAALSITSGNWTGDFSHITWYDSVPSGGGGGNENIPLPAAVWLFGTAVAGSAGFGAWRRRRASISA